MEYVDSLKANKFAELSPGSWVNGLHPTAPHSITEIDDAAALDKSFNTDGTLDKGSFKNCLGVSKCKEPQASLKGHAEAVLTGVTGSSDKVPADDCPVTETSYSGGKISAGLDSSVNVLMNFNCDDGSEKSKNSEVLKIEGRICSSEKENQISLAAMSDRLIALSSDSSLDVDDDLEALLRADETGIFGQGRLDSGDSISTHSMSCLGKNSPVSGLKNNTEHTGQKGVKGTESAGDVNSLKTKAADQTSRGNDTDTDGTVSDDSVICLDNDDDDDNDRTSSKPTGKDKVTAAADGRPSVFVRTSELKAFPGVPSVYPVLVPPKPVVSSIMPSFKPQPSSIILPSSSRRAPCSIIKSNSVSTQQIKSVFPQKENIAQQVITVRRTDPRPVASTLSEIGLQIVTCRVYERRHALQKKKLNLSLGKISDNGALDNLLKSTADPARIDHFRLKMLRCTCGFATESVNVLELHYESGRESGGLQYCCLCEDYSARYPSQFIRHMEIDHGRKVKVPPKPSTYLCQLCTFETNGKAIHEKHVRQCQRLFVLKSNQHPNTSDSDIPIERADNLKPKLLNCGIQVLPRKSEASISMPTIVGNEPNFLRFGGQLFVVVSETTENTIATPSFNQKSTSHLPVINVEKLPVPSTKLPVPEIFRTQGQSPNFIQLPSDKLLTSGVTTGLLATSVLPLSNKMITSDSMWASKLAAAAAKSVLSNQQPSSKVIVPPNKSSSTPGATLLLPSSLSSTTLPSANRTKIVIKRTADQITHSSSASVAATVSCMPSVTAHDVSSKSSHLVPKIQIIPTASPAPPVVLSQHSVPVSSARIQVSSSLLHQEATSKSETNQGSFVICPLCNGFVKDFQALSVHMRVTHKTGNDSLSPKIKCIQCYPVKWFSSKDALCKHQLDCHSSCSNSQGYCLHCEESGISDILAHVKEKHNISLLSMRNSRYCFLCRSQFETTTVFESHMIISHKDLFPDLKTLHNKIYSSGTRTSCRVCKKQDIFNLVRHMENRHNLTLNEMLQLLLCHFCSSNLEDAISFENHMLDHHADLFPSRDSLWDEIFARKKPSEPTGHNGGFCGTFKCSLCDDEFVSACYRYRHQIISHPNHLPFSCSLCKKTCGSDESLLSHLRTSHCRSCSVNVKRLNRETFDNYSSRNNSSADSVNHHNSSPETVVITDEEDEKEEPLPKQPRLTVDDASDATNIIPPEAIEEVLEIDGETIIIVQEADC